MDNQHSNQNPHQFNNSEQEYYTPQCYMPPQPTIPESHRPISAWGYFGYQILFSIPLIGFICLIVFALSSNNINLRNYARSYFCTFIIVAIVVAIGFGTISAALLEFLNNLHG